jgi:YD repeat-containing protein
VRPVAINHVSIPASDVDAAMRWWRDTFGMDELPSPNFGFPVRWLRLGDFQLHFFHSSDRSDPGQHFGMQVDDFEEAYRTLKEAGVFDASGPRVAFLYELPSGQVQLYVRDPFGNLVEINHPDIGALDRSLFGDDLTVLADLYPQDEANLRARLFLEASDRARISEPARV